MIALKSAVIGLRMKRSEERQIKFNQPVQKKKIEYK